MPPTTSLPPTSRVPRRKSPPICTVAMSISFLVYIIVAQYYFGFKWGMFPVQGWTDNPRGANLSRYLSIKG